MKNYSKRIILSLILILVFFLFGSLILSSKLSILLSLILLYVVFVLITQKRIYPFISLIGMGSLGGWVVALYQHVGIKGYVFNPGEFSFFIVLPLISLVLIALDGANYFNEYQNAPLLGKKPLF